MITELSILNFLLAVAHPVPGIVELLANDFFEASGNEKSHGIEAGLIHMTQRRMHHARGHVVRPQAGVAIAQSGVDDANFFHAASSLRYLSSNSAYSLIRTSNLPSSAGFFP